MRAIRVLCPSGGMFEVGRLLRSNGGIGRCRQDQKATCEFVPRSFGGLRYPLRRPPCLGARAQREGFRRYLKGLLLSTGRNKTLTAPANTEPMAGRQPRKARGLQWFLSESGWDLQEVNGRQVELLPEGSMTASSEKGILVIDEHTDRKCGARGLAGSG
jgi:hypothetical protein